MNNIRESHEGTKEQKQGITSFNLIDSKIVFKELNLQNGDSFLDIGCGAGDYAINASSVIGEAGIVYALDQWEETISTLNEKVVSAGITNIKTLTADITEKLPLNDNICNICFIAMVLHGIDLSEYGEMFFKEILRILKPNGRIVVIEIKKEETRFGPPHNIRISPSELKAAVEKYKFKKTSYTDLDFAYLMQFEVLK